jgi:hypothetical protein
MTAPPNNDPRNSVYERATRSTRRMTAWRRVLYAVAAPVAILIMRFWWLTCRVVRVVGEEHMQAALAAYPSIIPCYWHQHALFCARYLLQQRALGLEVGFLISPSVDGELGATLVRRVSGHVIRGSSTYTGARALRDFYLTLTRSQVSPVITPDGPRGPAFVFKPGAILLSQMSQRPIVPLAYAASRAWLVNWDRFVIPVPGARIAIAIGAPRQVPRALDTAALERWQRDLERELRGLFESARAALR